jgi:trans-aconitate methyltransferase
MADKFPHAEVIGTDLSPHQPTQQPPNLTFEVDDCTSEWVCPPNHFDFIHIRGLLGSIADWPALYSSIFTHLAPGGYLEQIEPSVIVRSRDGSPLAPETVLGTWTSQAIGVGKATGKTFEISEKMASLVKEAGFVDVVEKRFQWPIGSWSSDARLKEIGRWNLLNHEEDMEGWILALCTRVLGVSTVRSFLCTADVDLSCSILSSRCRSG